MTHGTTSIAYRWVLHQLLGYAQYWPSPRGHRTSEILDMKFSVVEPSDGPIVTADQERNTVIADYLEKEKRLYASGERRAAVWAEEASKFWAKIANSDGSINSNYGYLIFMRRSLPGGLTPWEWAVDSLQRDRDSRQAFVRVSLPEHQAAGVLDQPCTMHLMYCVREGRVNATAVMRSNDAVKGLVYDMPWFCGTQLRMAAELGLEPGIYTHIAHSMHLYNRDREIAEKMVGRKS